MNRPGLLLANGHVYIGFGSPGCNGSDQGWIMSYSTSTLLQDGVFDDEPGAEWAAIWQQGAGISADAAGRIYAASGEGPFSAGVDLPVSVFKLAQGTGQLPLSDWFTPYNWQSLSSADLDLENAVMILPTQSGLHPYEAITVGKQGTIYLLDRRNTGHFARTARPPTVRSSRNSRAQSRIREVPPSGITLFISLKEPLDYKVNPHGRVLAFTLEEHAVTILNTE